MAPTHRRVSPAVRAVSVAKGVDIPLLTELLTSFLDHSHEWTIGNAAAHGRLYLVQTLSASTPVGDFDGVQDAMDFAAECGHLDVVQWLHWNRMEGCTADAMDMAAANGHLHVVQWLHVHRREGCTSDAMDLAAAGGHLHVVQWLHMHRDEGCSTDAMDAAAVSGHFDVVQWLHMHRAEGCTYRALVDTSYNGHFHIVTWLAQFGRQSSIMDAIDVAAQRGHSNLVVWLAEHLHAREKQAFGLTIWQQKSIFQAPERDAAKEFADDAVSSCLDTPSWSLSFAWKEWKWTDSDGPDVRRGHSMCFYKTQLIVFGGRTEDSTRTHIPKTYEIHKVNGTLEFLSHEDKIARPTDSTEVRVAVYLNNVWSYDVSESCIAFSCRDSMWQVLNSGAEWGGCNLNDLWVYDMATNKWTDITETVVCPDLTLIDPALSIDAQYTLTWLTGRAGHSVVYYDHAIFIHGGYRTFFPYPSTTGRGAGRGTLTVRGNGFIPFPTHPYYLQDFWKYNLSTGLWEEITPTTDESDRRLEKVLPPRLDHTLIAAKGGVFVLFGGYITNYYDDDTWQYNTSANRWVKQTSFVHALYPDACTDDLQARKLEHSGNYKAFVPPADLPDTLDGYYFIKERYYGTFNFSVFAEPTRGSNLEPVFTLQARRQAPGWDGCRDRSDGRTDLAQELQWAHPSQRAGHMATYHEGFDKTFVFGGHGFEKEYLYQVETTYPGSSLGDLCQYYLNNCPRTALCTENAFTAIVAAMTDTMASTAPILRVSEATAPTATLTNNRVAIIAAFRYPCTADNLHYSNGINIGNIYFEQQQYPTAIRMYRMALDQIPNTSKEIRYKIKRNIGTVQIKLGHYQDAAATFEDIMEGNADFQSGFNLIICYYAIGEHEKMRREFTNLISIPMEGLSEEEEEEEALASESKDGGNDDRHTSSKDHLHNLKTDGLKAEIRARRKKSMEYILIAAKLCAPALDKKDWLAGYTWVIDALKQENHEHLASEVEICKAHCFLKQKDFEKAIEVLKSLEKKDQVHKAMAATNLSYLYFIEGDTNQADKYASMAVRHQRYNAKVLVNKGNCLYVKNECERAKELFLEAIGVEADCIEAVYNLGLVNIKMGILNEALQAFEKLHSIVPSNTEVLYQIASLHDMMGNYRQAAKWFNILISCFGGSSDKPERNGKHQHPPKSVADPGVFARLGQIFNKDDDETQAFHYHLESYWYFPINLDVISWLGVWYVKSELYEKAIQFFERASQIQSTEVKWRLMVTSCYRRRVRTRKPWYSTNKFIKITQRISSA
ncbi:Intraflagellar transport protein 88, partial [Globisporangium splendens]